jgi:hypothetical protein
LDTDGAAVAASDAVRSVRRLLLLTLVCCSGSESTDAPDPDSSVSTGDAGVDTSEPPAMGEASVVVSGYPGAGMAPQYSADVPVIFYKADGSVLATSKTDAMGRASATIERNSFVAIVKPLGAQVDGAIVNPGDTLRFGPEIRSSEPNGTLQVTWPARTIPGYTTYYYVHTPCGNSGEKTGTSATIQLDKGCSMGPMDVVVTSRRSSQEATGVMTRRNVQANGGLVTVNLSDNGGTWHCEHHQRACHQRAVRIIALLHRHAVPRQCGLQQHRWLVQHAADARAAVDVGRRGVVRT